MAGTIDLNADLGETDGDLALLEVVTSASVACGGHAGDPDTMARACGEAVRLAVVVGAHPSYVDRAGFGRAELGRRPEEVADEVADQVAALQAIAVREGAEVVYVKPHGALYHRAHTDVDVAEAVAEAIAALGPLAVLAQPGSALLDAAASRGLAVATEAFGDRAYRRDGALVDRALAGAVLDDPSAVAAQAVAIARDHVAAAFDGSLVAVTADSLCVHGDSPAALLSARAVRAALEDAAVALAPFARPGR